MGWGRRKHRAFGAWSLAFCGWLRAPSSASTNLTPLAGCSIPELSRGPGPASLHTPLDAIFSYNNSYNISRLRGGWHTPSLTGRVGSSRPAKGAFGKADRRCYRNVQRQPRGRWQEQQQQQQQQQRGTIVGPAKASRGASGTLEGRRCGSIQSFPTPEIGGQRDPWAADGDRLISGGKLNAQRDGVSSSDGTSSSQDVHPAAEEEEECKDIDGLPAGGNRNGGSDDDDGGGGMNRNTIAFTALASASILVSYADRGNLASTIVPMGEQYGWSPGFEGLVLSAFFVGYASTQMFGGWLADRYGGRQTLILGLAVWSVFTVITPYAAAQDTTALLAARVGLGLGEGFAFPSVHAMIAETVPKGQRSTVVGCVTAASYMGALVAFSASPAIMRSTGGWEAVFYAFGGVSLLLLPAWVFLPLGNAEVSIGAEEKRTSRENTPGDDNTAGRAHDLSREAQARELGSVAMRLSKRKEVWAIVGAQFCQSVGMYGLLNWLPTYLHDARGLAADSPELGTLAAAPYAIQALTGAWAGTTADHLIAERGWRVKTVRQMMQTAGMLGPAICLGAAVFEAQADISVAWIILGSGISAVTLGGVSTNHLDISPRNAGLVFGAGNTAATIAGLVTVPLCGWLVETYDSWDGVFTLLAANYVLGALLFLAWVGDEEVE